MLKEELERTRKGKSSYCFPKQAEMYANNPDGITWRVEQVLAKALRRAHDPKALPEVSPEEVRCRGLEFLDGLEESPRTEKMRSAMPKMLGEGRRKPAIDEAREILQGMTAKTWRRDRDRALGVLQRQ